MAVINHDLPNTSQFGAGPKLVEINPTKNNILIESQGVRVDVYETMLCPNVKKIDTGEHNIKCTLCNGSNFIDRSPITTWAFLQNQTLIKNFASEGVWDDQQVSATFLTAVELQYFAKVVLKDFTTTFYELVQRQSGQIDRLKYPAFSVKHIIDQNGVEYEFGLHYNLDSNGDIKWIHNTVRPTIGTIYTAYYTYPITFRAINALHVNRFTQNSIQRTTKEPIQLNQQWVLKRDYLLTREDINGNPLKPNKTFVETTPGV